MIKKYLLTSCLTLLLMSSGIANAALVTYSGGLNGSSSDPYPGTLLPLAYDGSISLAKFDPSLGTLNSVTLDLTSVFNYATSFENKSPNSGSTVTKIIDQCQPPGLFSSAAAKFIFQFGDERGFLSGCGYLLRSASLSV